VTAVHDGFALEKSTVRAPLGGALMTRAMAASVARRGAVIRPRLSFRRVETAPGVWEVIRCSPHSARNGLSCADGQNLQLWNLDELGLRMTRLPVVGSASAAAREEYESKSMRVMITIQDQPSCRLQTYSRWHCTTQIQKDAGHPVQVEERKPKMTASYNSWAVDQVAGDIKEAICRVSDSAFDPSENANIPTVTYEVR